MKLLTHPLFNVDVIVLLLVLLLVLHLVLNGDAQIAVLIEALTAVRCLWNID